MIRQIIELLQSNEWYDGDEYIQIAKGKYEYPSSIKIIKRKIKRYLKQSK